MPARVFGALLLLACAMAGMRSARALTNEIVADTKFSHARGFYQTNFALAITCATPGASIYFTTNGSAPSRTNGFAYGAPIPIAGTTTIRARAEKAGSLPSNVDTHSYLFIRDILTQSTNGLPPPGWPAKWGDNKVDYGMDPDIVTKPPWSNTISNDLRALPSLSIVMKLDDLFNARTGIYANPDGEGRDWERPCSLELIYPDGRAGFAIRAGLRIRGGFSRATENPKHSFRVVMRDEYGDSKLRYPFFGPTGAKELDKFDLRTSQDGSWAYLGAVDGLFLNDPFSRDTLLALGQPGERGDWYHLYINGQYWGLYNSCERPEASFAASYFGGVPEDWDVLKPDPQLGYEMKTTDGNDGAWSRLWQAATNGFTSNSAYFRVQGRNPDSSLNPAYENLLDATNLIDYLLVIFWTGNHDGPISGDFDQGFLNNYYAFRDRTGVHGGFRFVTHDAELSLDGVDENRIGTSTLGDPARGQGPEHSNPYYLWTRLLPNAEFRMLVADRVQKHFFDGGALTREASTARFAARTNELYHAMTGESARWGDAQRTSPITAANWRNAVEDKMTDYFPYRAERVLAQLNDAGLLPALSAPAFGRTEGEVPAGFGVALTHPNATGEIFFTVDGSDPRKIGGGISSTAQNYASPIAIASSVRIRARVKDGASWSSVVEADYYPSQDFSGLSITEMNYNPLPAGAIDGDEFEFIELKNAGTNTIDLGGVAFTGISFTFTNGTQLAPGAFFLLGRNETNFAARYPGVPLNGIYSGKLDNSGEKISVRTPSGAEILSVTYAPNVTWPPTANGLGFTLVPISADEPTGSSGNKWRASTNPGGSPGKDDPASNIPTIFINELLTHTDLPELDAIELYNPTPADINIGGWYLSDDAAHPWKFRIPNGTQIPRRGYLTFTEASFNAGPGAFSLSSIGEELYLFSGSPNGTNLTGYSHAVKFGAAAKGVSFGRFVNSAGEEMFPAQLSGTLGGPNSGPRIGPAVLNEVQYHPATNYDEYVEILNITDAPLPLFDPAHLTNAWRVAGLNFNFPGLVTLPANGLALVVPIEPATFRTKYNVSSDVPIFGPYLGKLQDSGEELELQRPDEPGTNNIVPYITVDALRYNDHGSWPVAADGDGPALQRIAPGAFGNEPTNWFASGLTPGRPNHLNVAPVVALITPVSKAEFTLPTTIVLEAQANDPDGSITSVEFYDGATRIGTVTAPPYRMTWASPASGLRQLTAKARDNELGSTISSPVGITVHPPAIGSGFGMRGEYFNNIDLAGAPLKRIDANVDFAWPDEPAPGVRADGFSVRWTGRMQSLVSGTVTLFTSSADGVRLWLGGTLLIDNWTDHATTENSVTVTLQAGQLYDLKVEFYNVSGEARIQLAWAAAGLQRQAIPSAQLYPPANPVNQPPTIAISSPGDNSAFPPGNIALSTDAADADGAVYKVRYFDGATLLGESSKPPFNFVWANPSRGAHAITAIAFDDNLVASSSARITINVVDGFTTNETVIAAASSWKYWDRGSMPALDWAAPSYNDAGWSNGLAQLGYGDSDEATVLSFGADANDKYVTSYFRRFFNISTPQTITGLRIRMVRDDGVGLYLNGHEIFRDNLPAGPLEYDTLALTTFGAPEENTAIIVNVPAVDLVAGANILACEVHQGARDSSDISFELELTAIRSVLAPYLITQPHDEMTPAGATMSLTAVAGGAPPLAYQWQFGGVNLAGANGPTLRVANFSAANAGAYTVIVSNALGSITSAPAVAKLSDALAVQVDLPLSGAPRLHFQRVAGTGYRIEWAASLPASSWSVLTNLPASLETESFDLLLNGQNRPAQFFRVVRQ